MQTVDDCLLQATVECDRCAMQRVSLQIEQPQQHLTSEDVLTHATQQTVGWLMQRT